MMEFDKTDELIAQLLEQGAIEIVGFDSRTEQVTYRITEKCLEIMPELFEEHFAFINELAFSLWNKGYIEMKFDEEGRPAVMLKDIDYKKDVFPNLNEDETFFIENMIDESRESGGII